ncbi:MAG: protein kinase [Verrucomicrobiae bacterium]|nr:protein kinase [Verrucomicrobiae bacterium]
MNEPTEGPRRCPMCDGPLGIAAALGFCPGCLLRHGQDAAETIAGPARFDTLPVTADEMTLLFPELEVIRLLGRGGMGVVYLARQVALDRMVAVKVLPTESSDDPQFSERFRREAAVLARLKHPNIVTLYDFGERGEFLYFLMEFVDGVDLSQRMAAGSITTDEALSIVPQICDALEFSHRQGIVHRDIKPANILIDRSSGQVKIADFGLAKFTGPADPSSLETRLTMTNMALGTPRYMAPEQMDNAPTLDHRVDLYALGVVLYEMLTGEAPAGSFEPPSAKRAKLDERMDDVILKAMEPTPERRYGQASEIKTEFTAAMQARNLLTLSRRHRAFLLRVAPASLIAIALSVGAVLWINREKPVSGNAPRAAGAPSITREAGTVLAFPLFASQEAQVPEILRDEKVIQLATAESFGIALLADGTVRGWGANDYQQATVPDGLQNCVAIAVGNGAKAAHCLALTTDGKVIAWGDDSYRQASVPEDLRDVVQIAAGQFHSVALCADGSVRAWGYDVDGVSTVPPDLGKVKAVTAGEYFTACLSEDGQVIAWGAERAAACAPPSILLAETCTTIAAGASHLAAATSAGEVFIWGECRRQRLPISAERAYALFAGANVTAFVDPDGNLQVIDTNGNFETVGDQRALSMGVSGRTLFAVVGGSETSRR